jgi:predicted PurR-regulated permease PerM
LIFHPVPGKNCGTAGGKYSIVEEADFMEKKKIGRAFFLFLLIVLAIVFLAMVRPFFISLLLAALFAGLFYPVYSWLCRRIWSRPGFCSIVCVLLVLLVIILPIVILLGMFTIQAFQFKDTAEAQLREVAQKAPVWLDQIRQNRFIQMIPTEGIDWQEKAAEGAKILSSLLLTAVSRTSKGAVQTVFMLFIMFYTLFYFFIDGPQILKRIKYISPLKDEYKDRIIERFLSIARATLKGTILIGLIQGTLGGITFYLCGVGSSIFWGTVMVIVSIIPGIGTVIVWLPAAVIKFAMGERGPGIGILAGGLIISVVDNFLRPLLVGRDTKMHALLIFFSTLGGIVLFGIVGFLLGPILAAAFLTVIDIYAAEYREELDELSGPGPGA